MGERRVRRGRGEDQIGERRTRVGEGREELSRNETDRRRKVKYLREKRAVKEE